MKTLSLSLHVVEEDPMVHTSEHIRRPGPGTRLGDPGTFLRDWEGK